MDKFCSGWKDGRAKIEGKTQALATAVGAVAQAYAQGEHVIEGSFTPQAPPTLGGGTVCADPGRPRIATGELV
jgi:hypothetical protein